MRAWLCSGVVVSLVAACGNKVDTKQMEIDLRKRTAEMGLTASNLTCPSDVEAKQGRVFACQVELEGKKSYALDVTIKTVDTSSGLLTFDTRWHDGPAVQPAKLAPALGEALGKSLGAPVVVTCGGEPLAFLDAQRKLHCGLTAGGVKTDVLVDFDAALNASGWHLDPPLLAKAKLEELLTPVVREKTGPEVTIDCGPEAFLRRPADGVVHCTAHDGASTGKLDVEVDGDLNLKHWQLNPT